MREIKFQGKRVDNREWVYGNLVRYIEPLLISDDVKEWVIIDEIAKEYTVDEKTVGQFTGLFDKNGKEIYEGDIVKATQEGQSKNGVVVFRNGGLWWEFEKGRYSYLNEVVNRFKGELIGNINDNPGLIEVKQ